MRARQLKLDHRHDDVPEIAVPEMNGIQSTGSRYFLALFVAASALSISNCGGGGGSTNNPTTPTETLACPGSVPGAPAASGTVNLTWDMVTAANLAGYRVYYGTVPNTYLQPVGQGLDAGNITAYTVSGLNRGSRYYLAVTAYDAANAESTYSNEVCKVVP